MRRDPVRGRAHHRRGPRARRRRDRAGGRRRSSTRSADGSHLVWPFLDTRGRTRIALGDCAPGSRTCSRRARVRGDRGRNPSLLAWRSTAALAHLALGERDEAIRLAREEVELAREWGSPRASVRRCARPARRAGSEAVSSCCSRRSTCSTDPPPGSRVGKRWSSSARRCRSRRRSRGGGRPARRTRARARAMRASLSSRGGGGARRARRRGPERSDGGIRRVVAPASAASPRASRRGSARRDRPVALPDACDGRGLPRPCPPHARRRDERGARRGAVTARDASPPMALRGA